MKFFNSVCLSIILIGIQSVSSADSTENFHGLTDEKSIAFHDAAMDVLRRNICRDKFLIYMKKKEPKAFAFTVDPLGKYYQCDASFNPTESEKYALDDCNRKRDKSIKTKKNTPECKLFASNNTLLVSMADYGLKPPQANLVFAVQHKSFSAIKNMVENGADIHQTDRFENTPFTTAVGEERLDVVEYLLEKGSDIKHKDRDGFDALHISALRGNLKLFKFLLSKGADVNTTAKREQRKPIHNIVVDGTGNILESLISLGVDVNEPDKLGMTPLHRAVKSRNFYTIKILVENGANIHAKTKKSETPLDFTKRHRKSKIKDYLISKGAGKESIKP